MDVEVVSLEIQQVFVFVYGALIFWALVFTVAASIVLAIINLVNNFRKRSKNS